MAECPKLIAVAGGSCTGKTTLAHALARGLGDAVVVSMDWYYHDLAAVDPHARASRNFDCPDAFDSALLQTHVESLLCGDAVRAPQYDFTRHTRLGTTDVKPAAWCILEGLHALYWEAIRDKATLAVFLELAEGICLARRIERDQALRGRSPASVQEQFRSTVKPMFDRYVAPAREYADEVVRGDEPVEAAVARILAHPGLDVV